MASLSHNESSKYIYIYLVTFLLLLLLKSLCWKSFISSVKLDININHNTKASIFHVKIQFVFFFLLFIFLGMADFLALSFVRPSSMLALFSNIDMFSFKVFFKAIFGNLLLSGHYSKCLLRFQDFHDKLFITHSLIT